jgi:serine phosphatase RsbU (regulator of sigma subunit)
VLITSAKEMGIIPYNTFTNYAVQFGGAWEMLMLSFAVGSKINQYRREKQQAEAQTHKATIENVRLVQEQNQILEEKVKGRTIELQEANEELHQQQEELIAINEALGKQTAMVQAQKQQLETTFTKLKTTSERLDSSIRYAQQIQEVILPDKSEMLNFFDDYFAIYLPKDVVSGDFYWFMNLGVQKNEIIETPTTMSTKDLDILEAISQKIIFDFEEPATKNTINKDTKLQNKEAQNIHKALFVLADCTGHGVSGAFMSMIGHTLLHEIVVYGEKHEPAKILRTLNHAIINVLKQREGKNGDGMDISVCLLEKNIETQETTLTFAGAKTVIYYHKAANNFIEKIKGERMFIGGFSNKERHFSNQVIQLQKGDTIYCLSDGYADQNNSDRQGIGIAKVEQILYDIHDLSFVEQQKYLLKTLHEHQGNEMQRDDITVLGLRI